MIHIYEKVCKTRKNEFGVEEMDYENPFKKGPCVITILAITTFLKELNGAMRQVSELVNPEIDTSVNPDRRIFGLSFGEYDKKYDRFSSALPNQEDIDDFVEVYIYPLFTNNNCKIDLIQAMKNFRNLTFVTYCNGSKIFKRIEDAIKAKMIIVGYSEDEIGMIFSQICVAAISGNYLKKKGTSTLAMTFGDVNDHDFETNKDTIESINESGEGFITYDDSIGFGISGDGSHSFKKHMTEDPTLSSKISAFINASLDNALENKNSNTLIPITYEKIQRAFDQANEEQNNQSL
jgi:hypothetical protein